MLSGILKLHNERENCNNGKSLWFLMLFAMAIITIFFFRIKYKKAQVVTCHVNATQNQQKMCLKYNSLSRFSPKIPKWHLFPLLRWTIRTGSSPVVLQIHILTWLSETCRMVMRFLLCTTPGWVLLACLHQVATLVRQESMAKRCRASFIMCQKSPVSNLSIRSLNRVHLYFNLHV